MVLRIFLIILFVSIQFAVTYFISSMFEIRFLDTMFFSSIGFLALGIFFSSSGGIATSFADNLASKQTFEPKAPTRDVAFSLRVSPFVLAALLFFISYWVLEFIQ